MEFKYSTVILSPQEMFVAGRIDAVTSSSVPYALHKSDIDSLIRDFQHAIYDREVTINRLKTNGHLSINTERVFSLQTDKTVATNALNDIANRKAILEARRQKTSRKLHLSLFLEPPINYDDLTDPAS